jgi:hypothetical protein
MVIFSIEKNPRQELLSLILHESNKNEKPPVVRQTGINLELKLNWN